MARRQLRRARPQALAAGAAVAALAVGLTVLAAGPAPAGAIGPVGGPTEYTNPVHDRDFPDPFVLRAGPTYYAYGTHRGLANIQILRSDDLVTWRDLGTALPFLPGWAAGPYVWAPSVLSRPGAHVLYYAVTERASGLFCVSAAVSAHGPQGPFVDRSTEPLVCQRDRRGTIDPSPFVDADGTAWLLYKSEGIEHREPTRIWIRRLAADGRSLVGPEHQLLATAQAWEGPIIENPAMIAADGRYFLFYSANRWRSEHYAVGFAVCDTPTGPCHRAQDGPLFASANGVAGPGGVEFFTDPDGGTWMAYHAWSAGRVGYPAGARSLRIDRVTFAEGRPWVSAPTTGPTAFDHVPGPPPPPPPPSPPPPPPPPSPAPAPEAAGPDGAPHPPPGGTPSATGSDLGTAAPAPGGAASVTGPAPTAGPAGAARRVRRALPEVHPPAHATTPGAPRIAPAGAATDDLALGGAGAGGDAAGVPAGVPVAALALLATGVAVARTGARRRASDRRPSRRPA